MDIGKDHVDILERQNDNLKEDWLLERQQLLSYENIEGIQNSEVIKFIYLG